MTVTFSEISRMPVTRLSITWFTPSIISTVSATRDDEASISPRTSPAASWLLLASLRTSSATTANPLPSSPDLAASMAALRASRLVWKAMVSIVVTTWFMRCEVSSSGAMPCMVSFMHSPASVACLCSRSVMALISAELVAFIATVRLTSLTWAAVLDRSSPWLCARTASCWLSWARRLPVSPSSTAAARMSLTISDTRSTSSSMVELKFSRLGASLGLILVERSPSAALRIMISRSERSTRASAIRHCSK